MSDSADRAKPVEQAKPEESESNQAIMQGLTSLSDWAEFGSLIRKLDEEYAETLAGPLPPPLEKPKTTGR